MNEKAKNITGVHQWPYRVIPKALEVIPRTLIQNCGGDTIRTLTALRAKHATTSADNKTWGINGETGELTDISKLGIWEPLAVKLQAYKTAIEVRTHKNFLFLNCYQFIFSFYRLLFCCFESMALSRVLRRGTKSKKKNKRNVTKLLNRPKNHKKMTKS